MEKNIYTLKIEKGHYIKGTEYLSEKQLWNNLNWNPSLLSENFREKGLFDPL